MNKKIPLFGLVLLACLLSSCHKNPLKIQSEQKSTRFLINASVAAEHSLHLGLTEIAAQRAYLNCMDDKVTPFDCTAFYQAMADFSTTEAFTDFKAITVADLMDKSVFNRLRDAYEERFFFNNLDH